MRWLLTSILIMNGVSWSADSYPSSGRVIFPDFRLKSGAEFIERVHLSVECAHIDGVNSIPEGWSIDVVRMGVLSEMLKAEADHGATRLTKLGAFNGGMHITSIDPSCFSLKATIFISGEADRLIELTGSALKVAP